LIRIRWTAQTRYPQFAEPTVRAIYRRIRFLKTAPNQGRPGHRSGTRELTLALLPYLVVYSVSAEAVEILHIYHGTQDWR
jgi:plasmid stabilization system protein ParE